MSPIPSIRNRFGGRNSRNEAPDNFPPSFRINRGYSSASGSRSAGGLRRSASGTSSALDKARQVKKAFAFYYYYYYFSFFLKNIKVFSLIWWQKEAESNIRMGTFKNKTYLLVQRWQLNFAILLLLQNCTFCLQCVFVYICSLVY